MSLPTPYYDDGQCVIYHADCRDVVVTADAIVTDPPYAFEALYCWSALASVATATLRPGGWLAAYSGEMFLPDVLARMNHDDLAYRWTMAVAYEGGGDLINRDDMQVLCNWKPVLVYRRRPFGTPRGPGGRWTTGTRTAFCDLIRRGGREKTLHPWAQPAAEAAQIIQAFSRPGDVVLDPFMGSGTTLRAAKDLGRRAVGIEVDERYCRIAVDRLRQGALDFGGAA